MASSTQRAAGGRLSARTVFVRRLDDATREAMWQLYSAYYRDATREVFFRDLSAKERVILLRDRARGTLRGFSTLTFFRLTVAGRRVAVIYSGDTVIQRAFWGHSALQRAFLRQIVGFKLKNPHLPVYWYLITKGYRTYLLLSRNFPEHWPRHERPTPPWQRALIDAVARRRFAGRWQPERGILRYQPGAGLLREEVAPVSDVALEHHPDMRFFCQANPGHAHGEELCCIGRVDPPMWAYYLRRLAQKKLSTLLAKPRR